MFVLGLDIGYSNLNLTMGAHAGKPTTQVRPVGAAPIKQLPQDVLGRGDEHVEVLVSDDPYAACVEPDRFENWNRILYSDYPATDQYRALFRASLAMTQRNKIDVLVTGLPVTSYQDEGETEKLRSQLQGRHQVRENQVVEVEQVVVIPQPVGSYLDYMVRSDREEELAQARVLVIDPGFFSVDWVQLAGHEILPRSSGTSTEATSRVLEEAAKLIRKDKGVQIAPERIERTLRNGQEAVYAVGDWLTVTPYLTQAAAQIAPSVLDAIQGSLRGTGDTIDVVLLTGGGAPFYEAPLREAFPHSQVVRPSNPVASNSRGFWWYGLSAATEPAEDTA